MSNWLNTEDMTARQLIDDSRRTLHVLWTKAVGSSTYNKEEWCNLEQLIREMQVRAGFRAVTPVQPQAQSVPLGDVPGFPQDRW